MPTRQPTALAEGVGETVERLEVVDEGVSMKGMKKLKKLLAYGGNLEMILPVANQLEIFKPVDLYASQYFFSSRDIANLAKFKKIEILAFRELDNFGDVLRLGMPLMREVRSLDLSEAGITHVNGIGAFQNLRELTLTLPNKRGVNFDSTGLSELSMLVKIEFSVNSGATLAIEALLH